MQPQLLQTVEIASKLVPGLLLLLVPGLLAKAAGLHPGEDGFWPRLVGAGLIALAAASLVETQLTPGRAFGLLGSATVNLTLAALLGSLLILGRSAPVRRGRVLLWFTAAALTLLACIEIVSSH